MLIFATLCFSVAFLAIVLAVIYQWRDSVPHYGNTMGGEMTTGLIWTVASLLCALGSLAYLHWLLAIAVFFSTLAVSFMLRMLIARLRQKLSRKPG